jgi:hypothetical protein
MVVDNKDNFVFVAEIFYHAACGNKMSSLSA